MDVLTKWNVADNHAFLSLETETAEDVLSRVEDYLALYQRIWWASPRLLPSFEYTYSSGVQKDNERRLDDLLKQLMNEMKSPQGPDGDLWSSRIEDFARNALCLEAKHIDWIKKSGILQALESFVRMARAFDPQLTVEDI